MGLLDDAIKEHLELKRRRGADAAEITRLESEALGPVSRSADGVPDLPDTFEAPDDPSAAADEVSQAPAPPSARPWEDEPTTVHRPPSEPSAAYEPTPTPSFEPPPITPDRSSVIPPPTGDAWHTAEEPDPAPENESARDFDSAPASTGLLSRLRGRRSKREPQPDPEPELERLDDPDDPFEPAGYEPPPPPPPPPSYAAAPPPVHREPDIVPVGEKPDVEDLLEETPEFLEETPEHDRLWFEQRPPKDFDFDG